MPYIAQKDRGKFDPYIEPLVEALHNEFLLNPKFKGNMNYVFTKISKEFMKKCEETYKFGYQEISDVEGALQGATHEWRRRVLDGYEDKKANDNGDV